MTVAVSITEAQIVTALGAYIGTLIDCPIVRGLDNRVPMPKGGFIALTPTLQKRLATDVASWVPGSAPAAMSFQQAIQYSVQIDCYGPAAGNWAVILSTMLRSEPAVTAMSASGVAPLYTDDPVQMPIVNGEQQWEVRWIVTCHVQASPVVSVPQQFANALEVDLINVDRTYPPVAP